MNITELKTALNSHPEKNVRFILRDGILIEPEFHVTEVGHVTKNFIDCGGTRRVTATCVLQTWVGAGDKDHRLSGEKLVSILDLTKDLFLSNDLQVEIEYEGSTISQYSVVSSAAVGNELQFTMGRKHTDCLAKESCGVEASTCCGHSSSHCC